MKMNQLRGFFRALDSEIGLQGNAAPGRISCLHGMSPVQEKYAQYMPIDKKLHRLYSMTVCWKS
jgi:hypothetical protein